MAKYSAIGPSTSAGKNVSAPTTRIVPSQKPPKKHGIGAQGAGGGRQRGLGRHRAGHRHHKDDRRIAADQDDEADAPDCTRAYWHSSPAKAEPLLAAAEAKA